MMISSLFFITNVKQLRTGGSFEILLPFFRTSWRVGVLNSAIFNRFQIGLCLTRFWRAFEIFFFLGGGGVFEPPQTPLGTPLISLWIWLYFNTLLTLVNTFTFTHYWKFFCLPLIYDFVNAFFLVRNTEIYLVSFHHVFPSYFRSWVRLCLYGPMVLQDP